MKYLEDTYKVVVVIAAIATAIAAWVGFYYGYWKPKSPFEPKITFGAPVLRQVGGLVTITLGIVASNVGGQPGCIADMAVSVQSKIMRTRWTWAPVFFVDMKSYLQKLPEKQDITPSVNNPFSSVVLPASTSETYSVFFMPRTIESPKVEPLQSANLTVGDTYIIELFIVVATGDCAFTKDQKWISAAKSQFVLSQEQLEGFKEGLAVIPLDTVRDKLREKFLRQ